MTLCHSTVWLALVLSQHQHHRVSLDWLDTIGIPATILFDRATQQSLLRLLTMAAVMLRYGNAPLTNRRAWQLYEHFLTDDRIILLANEPTRLETRWKALAVRDLASPKT